MKMDEYRVVWKRVACDVLSMEGLITFNPRSKIKRFRSLKTAKKFMLLLGPTPWEYFGKKKDDYVCCSGNYCACDGKTYGSQAQAKIDAGMPAIEYIRLEKREVGPYTIITGEE
jgi:hypothetical protein